MVCAPDSIAAEGAWAPLGWGLDTPVSGPLSLCPLTGTFSSCSGPLRSGWGPGGAEEGWR
nr:MAG TPA: hypothetical protein [Caudoviricetes sp.]